MKKRVIWICGVILLLLLAGCGKSTVENSVTPLSVVDENAEEAVEEMAKPAEVEFKRLENVFGFANESGEELITIQDDRGVNLENPKQYNIAIGNNGQLIEIEYVQWQESNEKNNNRHTMYNFSNMGGYVYKAKNGRFIQNKSYLLAREGVIGKNSLFDLKSTLDQQSQSEKYLPADAETIAQIEEVKKRKVKTSSLLSESAEEIIGLFVFEREAEDMLASIAYVKGEKVLFKDFPAKYDKSGTWRIDGGDEPGWFEVMFLAYSDEGLLLGMSWGGSEGENLFVFKETNGVFQETDLRSGRYWAP